VIVGLGVGVGVGAGTGVGVGAGSGVGDGGAADPVAAGLAVTGGELMRLREGEADPGETAGGVRAVLAGTGAGSRTAVTGSTEAAGGCIWDTNEAGDACMETAGTARTGPGAGDAAGVMGVLPAALVPARSPPDSAIVATAAVVTITQQASRAVQAYQYRDLAAVVRAPVGLPALGDRVVEHPALLSD
jgi:hypothetical protein